MPGSSSADPALLAAYRAAHYVVSIEGAIFRLQVDRPLPEPVAQWLRPYGTAGWLSAFNPASQRLPILENVRRHQALWARLCSAGFEPLVGYATDPAESWPDETSLLVPAIDRDQLHRLAHDFGQAAYLWLDPDHPPELVLTTPANP